MSNRKRKDYDEALAMYGRGMSIGDIAKFYAITRQAMHVILRRRGCEFRPHVRYGAENNMYRGADGFDGRSHDIVEKAIKRGVLRREEACEACGSSNRMSDGRLETVAHHDDYNKPLDVRWLCRTCHHEWHKHNTAIARTIELPRQKPGPRKR